MFNSFETAAHSNDISKTKFVRQIRNIVFPTKPANAVELKKTPLFYREQVTTLFAQSTAFNTYQCGTYTAHWL